MASSTYAISGTLEALAAKLDRMVRQHEATSVDEAFSDNSIKIVGLTPVLHKVKGWASGRMPSLILPTF